MACPLVGDHFRARTCISPGSPKLETTRSLTTCIINSHRLQSIPGRNPTQCPVGFNRILQGPLGCLRGSVHKAIASDAIAPGFKPQVVCFVFF